MFSIFKKKTTSVDELIRAYQSQQTAIAEIEQAKSSVKTEAIESGSPDLDAVAKALDRLDLEVELHRQAQAEIRSRLELLIRAQLVDAKSEIERRRPELEVEMHDQARAAGQLFQQFVSLAESLPYPWLGMIARETEELITAKLRQYGPRSEIEAFLQGRQEPGPPPRDYRREWAAVQPASNVDPQGVERKARKTVARLLGEIDPYAGQPGCFGLGVK